MKYPENQFNKLIKVLPLILAHYKLTAGDISTNDASILNTLHFKCFCNQNYTDDNGNVIKIDGKRLLPLDENFLLYPTGCNDNHIETAMKRAIKQLQN